MFTIQSEKDIHVLGLARINAVRRAGRGMGKRTWKEYVQCLSPVGVNLPTMRCS